VRHERAHGQQSAVYQGAAQAAATSDCLLTDLGPTTNHSKKQPTNNSQAEHRHTHSNPPTLPAVKLQNLHVRMRDPRRLLARTWILYSV